MVQVQLQASLGLSPACMLRADELAAADVDATPRDETCSPIGEQQPKATKRSKKPRCNREASHGSRSRLTRRITSLAKRSHALDRMHALLSFVRPHHLSSPMHQAVPRSPDVQCIYRPTPVPPIASQHTATEAELASVRLAKDEGEVITR